jgi:hypothetical protein
LPVFGWIRIGGLPYCRESQIGVINGPQQYLTETPDQSHINPKPEGRCR